MRMKMKMKTILLAAVLCIPQAVSAQEVSALEADNYKVAYLGPEGTYTEEAAQFWFQDGEELLPLANVNEAVLAVQEGETDYAVIAQENTVGGTVMDAVDALIKAEDLYVVGEVVLPISQTLLGVPGAELSDIKTVCSHPQALKQSSEWRAQNLPEAKAQEMDSTAAAAEYVAGQQDPSIAAVAAPGAAEVYDLEILAENIQITDANKTRFYVLSQMPVLEYDLNNAVFVVTCDGSLVDDVMAVFHDSGLEMVSIHDRPEGSSLGRYHYVIEVEDEDGITDEQIEEVCEMDGVRFAGCFNVAEK